MVHNTFSELLPFYEISTCHSMLYNKEQKSDMLTTEPPRRGNWLVVLGLTLSQTSTGFYVSAVQVLKTVWEKEKLLIASNFPLFHSVFYSFGELSAIFIKFEFVVCKLFQFRRV